MFVDSYDWVMVPNIYGMSQFADGGTFTTKPYIAGSNYLRNPRLSMMVRTWQKLAPEKQADHLDAAAGFLAEL